MIYPDIGLVNLDGNGVAVFAVLVYKAAENVGIIAFYDAGNILST